jgi:hypothetical protein
MALLLARRNPKTSPLISYGPVVKSKPQAEVPNSCSFSLRSTREQFARTIDLLLRILFRHPKIESLRCGRSFHGTATRDCAVRAGGSSAKDVPLLIHAATSSFVWNGIGNKQAVYTYWPGFNDLL